MRLLYYVWSAINHTDNNEHVTFVAPHNDWQHSSHCCYGCHQHSSLHRTAPSHFPTRDWIPIFMQVNLRPDPSHPNTPTAKRITLLTPKFVSVMAYPGFSGKAAVKWQGSVHTTQSNNMRHASSLTASSAWQPMTDKTKFNVFWLCCFIFFVLSIQFYFNFNYFRLHTYYIFMYYLRSYCNKNFAHFLMICHDDDDVWYFNKCLVKATESSATQTHLSFSFRRLARRSPCRVFVRIIVAAISLFTFCLYLIITAVIVIIITIAVLEQIAVSTVQVLVILSTTSAYIQSQQYTACKNLRVSDWVSSLTPHRTQYTLFWRWNKNFGTEDNNETVQNMNADNAPKVEQGTKTMKLRRHSATIPRNMQWIVTMHLATRWNMISWSSNALEAIKAHQCWAFYVLLMDRSFFVRHHKFLKESGKLVSEQVLTSHLTGHFEDDILRLYNPTNIVKALKDKTV